MFNNRKLAKLLKRLLNILLVSVQAAQLSTQENAKLV